MISRNWILLLVGIVLAAGFLLYPVYKGEEGDFTKVLVINLHIGPDGVTEKSVSLRYGHPSQAGLRSGTFSGRLLSADGGTVREFAIWDPRVQLGDEVVDDGQGNEVLRGAITRSAEADLLLNLPYTGVEEQFELRDLNSGRLLKSVSLSTAVASFAETYPSDPSGPKNIQPHQGVSFITLVAGCTLCVLMVLVIFLMIRKR